MKSKKRVQKLKFDSSSNLAYLNYLFNSFWRRPVGYVIAIAYILFLAIIFLVVPKIMGNDPLFIWKLTTFNVPIFSLFFVGAMAGALAVTIFRISREDGSELSLSAKPLTKLAMVGFKTIVYLIIMLCICVISLLVVVLIKPIYGTYSGTNPTGITDANYKGIILSMFVGNLINMLFFSGVAIFISMVGGQVAIMLGTIGLAFLMFVLNFTYNNAVKTPADVIDQKYQTTINSYSTYTRKQYEEGKEDTKSVSFAGIQLYVDDFGEVSPYDTYEYWTKASKESAAKVVAYLDFGNQLSSLYTGFGMEDSLVKDMAKTQIGSNIAYNYNIDKTTKVGNKENANNKEYPIFVYTWNEVQGKYRPCATILGPTTNDTFGEWYLWSIAYGMEFSSVSAISSTRGGYTYPGLQIAKKLDNKIALTLDKLFLTDEQKEEIKPLFSEITTGSHDADFFNKKLTTSPSGIWQGNWADLSVLDKFNANAKIFVYFMTLAQQWQFDEIGKYLDTAYPDEDPHTFPFTSVQVMEAYTNSTDVKRSIDKTENMVWYGYKIGKVDGTDLYCNLNTCEAPYCETLSNFYKYTITNIYSTAGLSAIWGSIALALFAAAIIVYRKTDFK